jgi:hypothetical protein
MRVSLSHRVYSSEILFRDTSYLSRISNGHLESHLHQRLLHNGFQVRRVVLSKDDFGVRNIRFFPTCSSSVILDGSPWYENLIFEGEALDFEMVGDSDVSHSISVATSILIEWKGLLLRSVRSDQNVAPVVEWNTPNPPEEKAINTYSCFMDSPKRRRMQHHPLPETVSGLTVCCRNKVMIGLYAHSSEISSYSSFIDSVQSRFSPQGLLWVYFPIQKGEGISNIWVRSFKNLEGRASCPLIMVSLPLASMFIA